MSREWKVGDRFSVEGVVTALPDSDGDYRALFDGHTGDGCVIAAEMENAKLIGSRLDSTKPIRIRRNGEPVTYIGPLSNGQIVVEEAFNGSPQANTLWPSELENVPEEKRKASATYYLVENSFTVPIPPRLYVEGIHGKVIGQKLLEITEGDGMEDEQ